MRLVLAVTILCAATGAFMVPAQARELQVARPAAKELTAARIKQCLHVLRTGDEAWYATIVDCQVELKFDQYCYKLGMYPAVNLLDQSVCSKKYEEASIWEEAEFLLKGIAEGVITGVVTAGPYVLTAAHVVACVYGELISCAIAANSILELAGVDVPYGNVLGSAILAAECYEGNYVACVEFADSVGADKAPLVGAAFAKSKETLKTTYFVVNCIEDQTASNCAQAIGAVGKQAGVKLPTDWANDFYAMLTQCENGNIGSCIKAAEMLGLPKDNLISKAFNAWEKGAQQYQAVQACLVQGNLSTCGAAAGSVAGSYAPYLPQDYIKKLEADLKACANGDPKACERAADALDVPGGKAVEAAKQKSQGGIMVASTDVPDEGSQSQGQQRQATTNTASMTTVSPKPQIRSVDNGNDNQDDPPTNPQGSSEPKVGPVTKGGPQTAQRTASPQVQASGPPAGFKEQASYSGDCSKRPAGTLCLNFTDAYVWLVSDKVLKHEDRGTVAGHNLRVVVGEKAEYHHLLHTKYVREVKK